MNTGISVSAVVAIVLLILGGLHFYRDRKRHTEIKQNQTVLSEGKQREKYDLSDQSKPGFGGYFMKPAGVGGEVMV